MRFEQRWGLMLLASGFSSLPRQWLTSKAKKTAAADLVVPTFTKDVKVGQPPTKNVTPERLR